MQMFLRNNVLLEKLHKNYFNSWKSILTQKFSPQNFRTKRVILFAKYCNKLVKKQRLCQQFQKKFFLVARPLPPPPHLSGRATNKKTFFFFAGSLNTDTDRYIELISGGNSEHIAHVCWNIGLF